MLEAQKHGRNKLCVLHECKMIPDLQLTVMSMHHSPHVILCNVIPFSFPLQGCNAEKANLKALVLRSGPSGQGDTK